MFCPQCNCNVSNSTTHLRSDRHKFMSTYNFKGFVHIKNHPDYMIHRDGRIVSIGKLAREMKSLPDKDGYQRLKLDKVMYILHRLLAIQFIPNPKNRLQIDHINRNVKDNRIENLRWCTQLQNSKNK